MLPLMNADILLLGRIIEAMLAINRNLIRLKSNESINNKNSTSKRELHGSDRLLAFKIDQRHILDTDDKISIDAGEIAKSAERNKLYHDLGKLLREGKDVLDGLIDCSLADLTAVRASGWGLQICGLHGHTSVIRVAEDGLYAGIPVGKFSFPCSIIGLSILIDTSTVLMTFVTFMEIHVQDINAAISELDDKCFSMGKNTTDQKATLPGHTFSESMRPTWYSYVRNNPSKSRVLPSLFGGSSSSPYFSHDFVDSYDTTVDNDDTCNENEDSQVDEYGY